MKYCLIPSTSWKSLPLHSIDTRLSSERNHNCSWLSDFNRTVLNFHEINTIHLNSVVYPKGFQQDEIEVYTTPSQYTENGYRKNWTPVKFNEGERVIVLLAYIEEKYIPIYDMYGKIPIENSVIAGTNCTIEDYINELSNIKYNDDVVFNYYIPPYITKSSNDLVIAKIADYHSTDLEFDGKESCAGSEELEFEWNINPSGALRDTLVSLTYNQIEPVASASANSWTTIDDANLDFSIGGSTGASSSADGNCTICFDNLSMVGATIAYHSESDFDIICSTHAPDGHEVYWRLPGDSDINYGVRLRRGLSHEMGHTILSDLTSESEKDQLMYNQRDANHDIEYPQDGDKAGAVWSRPNPSGSMEFDQVWGSTTGSWTRVRSDVTVDETLTILGDITFDSGVDLTVTGDLILGSGIELDEHTASAGWGGITLETGGTIEYNSNPYIINATKGITYYGGSIVCTNANPTTRYIWIKESSIAGFHIYHSSPEVEQVRVYENDSGYGGFYIEGYSSSPIIHDCDATFGSVGIDLSSYASLDLYLTRISSNSSSCIDVGVAIDLNMDGDGGYGHNTIDPATGEKAIYNSYSSGEIIAENNYWGQTPTDALFGYPASVDYDPYLGSAYSGVGVAPKVSINPTVFYQGSVYEKNKHWNSAINVYRQVITNEATIESDKIRAVKNMFRVYENSGMDYSELKDFYCIMLANHKTVDLYHAFLDILITEIDIREGNYFVALGALEEKADKYSDTSLEVELLARAADVCGRLMNNKSRAKIFAERAAALNPGQKCLMSAFDAADIAYNPQIYEDIYENEQLQFQPFEDDPVSEKIKEYVIVSPNPANPISNISYSIAEPSHVTLDIFSITGQKVATLVDDYRDAGEHTAVFDGAHLSSGLYLYRFRSESFSTTGRLMIVK